MLSVNIKTASNDTLFEVKEVQANYEVTAGYPSSLTITKSDGELFVQDGGEVFVMNSQGNTIARYNLDSIATPVLGQRQMDDPGAFGLSVDGPQDAQVS